MRRHGYVLPFVILIAVLAGGCVALPVDSVSPASTGTPGAPVLQAETAAPLATPRSNETAAGPTPDPIDTAAPSTATTAAPAAAPTATQTIAAASSGGETAAAPAPTGEVGRYRGPSAYGPSPLFEVTYDPAAWEYVEDDGSGRPSQLKHRTLTGCALWLRAGPVGAETVASVFLAGTEWKIAQVNEKAIQYVLPQDRFAWIFGLILPETYTGMANSTCQDAAERVIDTFQVAPDAVSAP